MKLLPTPKIFIGQSSLVEVANILNELKVNKVMVITGKTVAKIGIYDKLKNILEKANKEIVFTDDVQPDPDIHNINNIVNLARNNNVQAVIGLGGGSNLDTAKIAAALVTNTKDIDNYIGINLLDNDPLPIIAIPTTAGTGSEVTSVAVLTDSENKLKKVIVSDKIVPQYAILDPELNVSSPKKITAQCGMDALSHAIEAYTSKIANDYTDVMALKAIKLISENIRTAYKDGSNLSAREKMLTGSLFAGMAFGNVGVNAVHALAYPLSGLFHVSHGLSISMMLPVVMEFNSKGNPEKFENIARCMTNNPDATIKEGIEFLNTVQREIEIPENLSKLDIPETAISKLAKDSQAQARLLVNNPRELTVNDALEIYKKIYYRSFITV